MSEMIAIYMPTMNLVLLTVEDEFCVSRADLLSDRRMRSIARPRQVAMWLSARVTRHSLVNIGKLLGGRDHSTVIHGVAAVERLMKADPDFQARVQRMRHALEWPVDVNLRVFALAERAAA